MAIRADPDDAQFYYHRGVSYLGLGQYNVAIENYDEATRLNPQFALAYGAKGAAYTSLGQYEKAIDELSQAILLDLQNGQYYGERSSAYRVLGQHDLAIQDSDEAIRLEPRDYIKYNNRGLIYGDIGQYDKAIADLSEAIRLNPDSDLPYANRALTYTSIGNDEEAAQDVERAVALGFERAELNRLIDEKKKSRTVPPTPTPTPTQVPTATPTPTPTPRPTPVPTPLPTFTRTPVPPTPTPGPYSLRAPALYGPTDGSLDHIPEDAGIEALRSQVTLSNALVEAEFFNPYPTTISDWSSGFIIRWTDLNTGHRIFVRGNRSWYHYVYFGTVEPSELLKEVPFTAIDTSSGGSNHVRVIALGDDGWLFINGEFAGTLDLSKWSDSGDVVAVTGFFTDDEVAGESTVFQGFRIWSIASKHGPTDATLFHDPDDGSFEFRSSGVGLSDSLVEAEFFNPYATFEGTWSNGFILRRFGANTGHRIFVLSNGNWYHYLRTGTAESSENLQVGTSSAIDISKGGSNHLKVIALANDGWLFINGVFAGKLDLSGWVEPGDVLAATGLFGGDEVADKATLVEGFNVWAPGQ